MPSDTDLRFMRACLMLARRHLGRTAPNPSVAALVAADDGNGPVIIGRGITGDGGRPHAEHAALEQAGAAARGATLYVGLEPCAQRSSQAHGPSCAERIIAAGIARVVIGAPDGSRYASNSGVAMLREAGIDVTESVAGDAARALNLGHALRISDGRPLVQLKLAETADGFAGTLERKPIAITGEEVRSFVHMMRAKADAIMVGVSTALADDPLLNCRLPGMAAFSPVRVIVDSQLRCPLTLKLVTGARNIPTWVFAGVDAPAAREAALRQQGVEVMRVGAGADGRLDLHQALRLLADRGITRLMCEGGPALASSLAAADLADEVIVSRSKLVAAEGIPALCGMLRGRLADPALFARTDHRRAGDDEITTWVRQR